jgi:hypothetical protein
MNERIMVLVALASMLSGCQTMKAELPASRMESPETLGNTEKRVGFNIGVAATQDLQITSDASYRPPNLTSPVLEQSANMSGAVSYGAFDRIDLGVKSSLGPSPAVLSAKFQVIGEPSATAKSGNFSLSVSAGLGYWTVNRSGDQNGTLGPGGYNWSSKLTEKLTDFAVIAGVRVSDRALLYFGGFAQNITLDGKISHSLSDNGTSPAAEYSVSYTGKQRGGNFGAMLEFGQAPAYLCVEGVYSHIEFENDLKNWFLSGSASLGARF